MDCKKVFFEDRVEPFVYKKLNEKSYRIDTIDSTNLLTWNRLDLAFKLFYLDMKQNNEKLALSVYKEDIRCQTSGEFQEFGNKTKNSFDSYVKEFNKIYTNIKINGFDSNKTIIPLSKKNTVENGAHRVAASIYLKEKVTCAYFNLDTSICDYNFYHNRKVSKDILDTVVVKFIEYAKDTYIAFLWPSAKNKHKESEKCFTNIVYKTHIALNTNGAFRLLYELYKHMDWIGTKKNGFNGIKQKIVECFPSYEEVTVIVFQAENIQEVRNIKEKVRQIHNIGFSSIHITDTKEEASRISKLIFNDNGLHFLNYSNITKYFSTNEKLKEFNRFLISNNINKEDMVLDSGMVMSIYGIREGNDIDYLANDNCKIENHYDSIDCHDKELKYHGEEKLDLIYNPKFYFYYDNIKFISFAQIYKMKQNRNEKKDINDIEMMNAFIDSNYMKKIKTNIKQYLLYTSVRARKLIVNILKSINLYDISKNFYDKYLRDR